jgi:hypothetical protein
VKWQVEFHKDFDPEFDALPDDVQNELRAHALLLEQFGPQLGRPRVDTLKGSRHANRGWQVRRRREAILSRAHSKGRRKIR